MRLLFSIYLWVYYGFLFVVFFVLISAAFLVTFPFDPYRKVPNRILATLGFFMIHASPWWKIHIEGTENYKQDEPAIFICNHQSFLDMALVYQLPWQMKWVAKKSLLYIPVMGWLVWLTGHLTINRSKKSALKKLSNLVKPLNDNVPVMIFPEGTRTEDGELQAFKNGAFLLAKEYNFKIIPMVIDGGYDALKTGSKYLNPKVDFKVSVMEPIAVEDFENMKALKDHAHELLSEELDRIRSH